MSENYSYPALIADIEGAQLAMSLSELHGMITGCLCFKVEEPWLPKLGFESLEAGDSENIVRWHALTESELRAVECPFDVMLPEDDEPLSLRVEAMKDWCEGFLFAAALGDVPVENIENETVKEALASIIAVTNLPDIESDISEEDENDYVEIAEHVRMAAILIYTEYACQKRVVH